jgi:hypothetical protein
MRLNELIRSFEIYTTNEEEKILEQINRPLPLDSFEGREQVVIQNLIRKSLISRLSNNGHIYVMKND